MKPSDLNQRMIDMMSEKDRKTLKLESSADVQKCAERIIERTEEQIQATVEAWLRQNGYYPRTPEYIGMTGRKGWYVHLNETKRNPILLDLLILSSSGKWVEIELKTAAGRIRPMQTAIMQTTGARAFRTVQEAIDYLTAWTEGAKYAL